MIDLGSELAGYGGDGGLPPRPQPVTQPTPKPVPGGGVSAPLADLQAAGFNTEEPFNRGGWRVSVTPTWPNPSMPIKMRTWLPGDAGWAADITTPDGRQQPDRIYGQGPPPGGWNWNEPQRAEPQRADDALADDDAYRKAVFLGIGPPTDDAVTYGQGRLPVDWSKPNDGADDED